jgi:hypothetical protein
MIRQDMEVVTVRVLLMAEDDGLYARAAGTLRAAGHEVVGCHEAGSAASRWPCSGISDTCPLDEGVDAAVALRRSLASRVEAGVGCVVRQRVPLVIGGAGNEGSANGVAPFAALVVEGVGAELADAVGKVGVAPIHELSTAATDSVAATAERLGIDGSFSVEVRRDRRTMRVVIHSTVDLDPAGRSALGQAGFGPVRSLLPAGSVDSIDVSFADE